jgi:hypothetical protein
MACPLIRLLATSGVGATNLLPGKSLAPGGKACAQRRPESRRIKLRS